MQQHFPEGRNINLFPLDPIDLWVVDGSQGKNSDRGKGNPLPWGFPPEVWGGHACTHQTHPNGNG